MCLIHLRSVQFHQRTDFAAGRRILTSRWQREPTTCPSLADASPPDAWPPGAAVRRRVAGPEHPGGPSRPTSSTSRSAWPKLSWRGSPTGFGLVGDEAARLIARRLSGLAEWRLAPGPFQSRASPTFWACAADARRPAGRSARMTRPSTRSKLFNSARQSATASKYQPGAVVR